jgi:hypothetical protein
MPAKLPLTREGHECDFLFVQETNRKPEEVAMIYLIGCLIGCKINQRWKINLAKMPGSPFQRKPCPGVHQLIVQYPPSMQPSRWSRQAHQFSLSDQQPHQEFLRDTLWFSPLG